MVTVPRKPDFLNMQILEIRNLMDNSKVPFDKIEVVQGNHMRCLQLDGQHISKHHPYQVTYKCSYCESLVEVGITQVLRKIQKDKYPRCRYCKNIEAAKRVSKTKVDKPVLTMRELKSHYEAEFKQDMDYDAYFSYHLTEEEFTRLHHAIVSIPAVVEYWPIWKSYNQMRYTAMFYNPVTDAVDKVYQLQCKCEVCDGTFPIKNLHSLKNKYKVMCKDCSLCRNTFKRRTMCNMLEEKVIVQSKQEINFVKWCNEHNVLVRNGPKLKYWWKEKEHIYHLDFELPELDWLIEIKDNHVWHKEQVDNGKWAAKEAVALAQEKTFTIVYPNNWMRIAKQILERRYSLTLCKSIRS